MTRRSKKAWRKWRRIVSEQAGSGQTVTVFCRERALSRPYFLAWKKRLQGSAATQFLEVQVAEPVSSGDAGVEIRLRNGRSLIVKPGFDAEHVRALLAVVEAPW